ncbi:hypothetical protein GCM10017562_07040 [Streptomyces roseofulvus]|uniref:GNAT family N-acetyltransferase n=1 Tax=Streptomyces roseofulvus TaxID=33902 RepID=UPI0031F78F04
MSLREPKLSDGVVTLSPLHPDDAEAHLAGEDLTPGQVNIAYGLYPHGRGHGLATRAVLLALPYAAAEGGERALIQADPENTSSSAVATRAGSTPDGHRHTSDGTRLDRYRRDLRGPCPEGAPTRPDDRLMRHADHHARPPTRHRPTFAVSNATTGPF